MAECVVPKCPRPTINDRVFCKECHRLVKEDERYALRMASRSPAYSPSAWPECDGRTNLLWIWDDAHTGRAFKTMSDLTRAMHWLEYYLVAQAIGKRIARVQLRQRAKRRLRGPRGW